MTLTGHFISRRLCLHVLLHVVIILSSDKSQRLPEMAAEELPFKAEYAKSGRAGCKLCKGNISKDSLRLAKMVQVYVRANPVLRGHADAPSPPYSLLSLMENSQTGTTIAASLRPASPTPLQRSVGLAHLGHQTKIA